MKANLLIVCAVLAGGLLSENTAATAGFTTVMRAGVVSAVDLGGPVSTGDIDEYGPKITTRVETPGLFGPRDISFGMRARAFDGAAERFLTRPFTIVGNGLSRVVSSVRRGVDTAGRRLDDVRDSVRRGIDTVREWFNRPYRRDSIPQENSTNDNGGTDDEVGF